MKFEGFNRVIINHYGEAVNPKRASEMGVIPEIGYMRKDGWSLGAPKELAKIAYQMWAGEWKYSIKKGDAEWKTIGFGE